LSANQPKPGGPESTQIAGRYDVERKLGAGAFGTVYKVKDRILGRMLAIKTIRLEGLAAQGASLDELLKRFKKEAQVSAQLKHPNIVTIYDIGEADGLSYLAMEFLEGTGLDKVILQAGRLGVDRAAGLGAQVADALDFAHKNNVVHRDIKPANIMVEAGDRVKVTDFGIAKTLESADHLTMTGSLLGTPSYMSPEQARGEDLDGRSDLFSVGCVLYEMIAGKKAFRGDSITSLIFKIITEEPLALRELAADVPDEMVRIITKALAKKREARYQSGRELADDLLRLTRAGSSPTLRAGDTPTVPSQAMSGSPTVVGATTLKSDEPPTLNATLQTSATAAATPPPPLPKAAAATPRPLVSPPPSAPAPSARSAHPAPSLAASPPARRTGGGAGLLIGLAVVALGGVAVLAAGGWYFFLRKPPEANVASVLERPPVTTEATLPRATEMSVPSAPPAEPSATAATPAPPEEVKPAGPPTTAPSAKAVARRATPTEPAPVPPPVPPVNDTRTSGSTAEASPSFLDQEPEEPRVDGTEAARRLAEGYRSDQGSRTSGPSGGGRWRARERSPRQLRPIEVPTVATLRHVINAEEAYNKKHGRYGTFTDMAGQTLFLDVPLQPETFQRKGYRFQLEASKDGFKVTALPLGPGPRPFIADDSGIIRPGLE
jgi:serine/threonine protein kinase